MSTPSLSLHPYQHTAESLGGKAKTCIIATFSPVASAVEETMSTLDYAYRARAIKNQPTGKCRYSSPSFASCCSFLPSSLPFFSSFSSSLLCTYSTHSLSPHSDSTASTLITSLTHAANQKLTKKVVMKEYFAEIETLKTQVHSHFLISLRSSLRSVMFLYNV
jgi:hypothetical protein